MSLLKDLKLKGRVCYNEPLSKHTTFRIGGPARIWAHAECPEYVKELLDISKKDGLRAVLIGEGSNLLASDAGLDIIAVKLEGDLRLFKFSGGKTTCAAGCSLQRFILGAMDAGCSGLEFMAGIPGTLGGAVKMNAGAGLKGPWISDFINRLKIMDKKGCVKYISKEEAGFGYRESGLEGFVVLEAELGLKPLKDKQAALEGYKKFLSQKREKQELALPSAGCVFKNPKGPKDSAARLIDSCGLKGKSIGRAMVSRKHANFIVNTGGASFNDVMGLIELIRNEVYKKHEVELELEIEIIHSRDSLRSDRGKLSP
ncbi:MAG: UDP-N-acetylmuramate dehydrogenase [Candidatus Omnitrophica bacterium]|nr:UDP-N-acetylmuramate dehydrogenase [Candidatus Omnitrophota bacterium]